MRRTLITLSVATWAMMPGCDRVEPTPVVACDPNAFTVRCDANTLVQCEADGFEVEVDCGATTCNAAEERCGACGNNVDDPGEGCDDGNNTPGDGCRADCSIESCGDARLDPITEECDDGNTISGDDCDASCNKEPEDGCGDGVQVSSEECDDGAANSNTAPNACRTDCQLPSCGDGVKDTNEACDNGGANSNAGPCLLDCTNAGCGDGILNGTEECDDDNNTNGDGCSSVCSLEFNANCGNGITESPEACDDGNNINDDACRANCTLPSCGDNVVDAGEDCDNGGANSFVGPCLPDCTDAGCGDGVFQANEECDDANTNNNDGCSSTCFLETCGDGVLNGAEVCDDGNNFPNDGCSSDCKTEDFVALQTARSAPLAISNDDKTVVMVNQDTGTVSVFDVSVQGSETRKAILNVGLGANSEPWSVAITPDSKTAFVALRNDGSVVQINGLDTASPTVGATVQVGAEPTGIILSPTGKTAFVVSFVEGSIYKLTTSPALSVSQIVQLGGNPRGLCMTNDFDSDDDDEILFTTDFYSRQSGIVKPGVLPLDSGEGTDFGRKGVVNAIFTNNLSFVTKVDLLAIDNVGFNNGGNPTGAFPNQLTTCAVQNGRVYIPNTAASPRGGVNFTVNIQSFVSVFDIATMREVTTNSGSLSGTVNVNNLVKVQSAPGGGRQFTVAPVDIVFQPGTNTGLLISSGADNVTQVSWNGDGTITVPPAGGTLFTRVGTNPMGIVLNATGTRGYVANRVSRNLSIIDPTAQTELTKVLSDTVPTAATDQAAFDKLEGLRFFNTGRSRWSADTWVTCAGCHPDGLSDNVTWHFATGPRQSLPIDGSVDKNNPADTRIFLWTGLQEEFHDFEGAARNVSGGLGAQVIQDPLDATKEVQINLASVDTNGDGTPENNAGLNGSGRAVTNNVSVNKSWNQLEIFMRTVRPLNKSTKLSAASVAAGRQVFQDYKCQNCHGGPKWTTSRLTYTPSVANSATLKATAVNPSVLANPLTNPNALAIEIEEAAFCKDLDNDPATGVNGKETCGSPINTLRLACALRDVGTFGVFNPITGKTDKRIEVAADMVTQGQGLMGFNPPSLFGLSVSGPFLHNGQAETLGDLFSASFAAHHDANKPAGIPSLSDAAAAQQRADLINFLLSIDLTTQPIAPDPGQELCPSL